MTAPVPVLLDRVQRRGREGTPITREDTEQWARWIQAPTTDEMNLFDHAIAIETSDAFPNQPQPGLEA